MEPSPKSILEAQYALVQEARSVLLNFCAQVGAEQFTRQSADVGNGGSIRNLLVHIANSYHGWLAHFVLGKPNNKRPYESIDSLEAATAYLYETDQLVTEFLNAFDNKYDQQINGSVAGRSFSATPLQVFMHVITHEFHHKGQILVLARIWGVIPVDTDILRP